MRYLILLGMATVVTLGVFFYRQQPAPNILPNEQRSITVTGTIVCLPHKNTDGPITLECAYGLKDAQEIYYGLRDTSIQEIPPVNVGETVTVQGTLVPDSGSQYDIAGVIEADLTRK